MSSVVSIAEHKSTSLQRAESRPTPFTDACCPKDLVQAWKLCDHIAQSSICPKSIKGDPMAVMVAIQAGERHGFDILGSIQNIAVINGKPSMYGDGLLGVCRASHVFESIDERFEGSMVNQDAVAICTVKRRGEEPLTRRFNFTQAEKARLTNKPGPWSEYPERMMQMRARAFALRDAFADVLSGIASAEEVEDYSIVDGASGAPAQKPTGPVMDASLADGPVANPTNSEVVATKDDILRRIMKAQDEAEINGIRNSAQAQAIWKNLSKEEKQEIVTLREARLLELNAEAKAANSSGSKAERMKAQMLAQAAGGAADSPPAASPAIDADEIPY